ncbi:hypothetical protein LPJ73_003026 [Coemansia sp. RSA 2703]|nr:hypothetical protein LPJ73_003026 [Coemansia sp. RSA 2703]
MTLSANLFSDALSWKRIALGLLVVALGWLFAMYQRNKQAVDSYLRTKRFYFFNAFWVSKGAMMTMRLKPLRGTLWQQIDGTVLEIGPGFGEYLSLVPTNDKTGLRNVSRYIAMEPNMFMHSRLAENAENAGFSVQYDKHTCPEAKTFNDQHRRSELPTLTIVNGTLDDHKDIPKAIIENGPYDCIVSSMVLCSVINIDSNLKAIYSLLKPGGKFIFIEHVQHTDDTDNTLVDCKPGDINLNRWRTIQTAMTPMWSLAFGYCRLDRPTGKLMEAMPGWSKIEYKTLRQTVNPMAKMTPLIYGVAIKNN